MKRLFNEKGIIINPLRATAKKLTYGRGGGVVYEPECRIMLRENY